MKSVWQERSVVSNKSHVLLGGIALVGLLLSPTVKAADLTPVEEPVVGDWSGWYVGVHAGGTFRNGLDRIDCDSFRNVMENDVLEDEVFVCNEEDIADTDSPSFPGPVQTYPDFGDDHIAVTGAGGDDDRFGFLAGGQIGANMQSGNLVFGIEADASAHIDNHDVDEEAVFEFFSDLGAAGLNDYVGQGFITREADINWLATIRGRLGFAFGDANQFLLYGTGGVAFAGVDSSLSGRFADDPNGDICNACFFGPSDSNDEIKVGWTAGGGGEWAMTERVSLGLEYLFVKLGDDKRSITFTGDDTPGETRPTFDIVDKVDFDLSIIRAKLNVRF
jgi:outer membrane immunogenic protein